jgi:hypothetical protein
VLALVLLVQSLIFMGNAKYPEVLPRDIFRNDRMRR